MHRIQPHYEHRVSVIRTLLDGLDAELKQMSLKYASPHPDPPKIIQVYNQSNDYGSSQQSSFKTSYQQQQQQQQQHQQHQQQQKLTQSQSESSQNISPNLRLLSIAYNERAQLAYRTRRTFMVFGNFHTIRYELLRRGWLEKLTPNNLAKLQAQPEHLLVGLAHSGNDYERVLLSKRLSKYPAFFIWQVPPAREMFADYLPFRNCIIRGHGLDFSTKVGLIGCSEQEVWQRVSGISAMKYPRFYRLGGTSEERNAFITDYLQTQCRILIWFLRQNLSNYECIIDENGTVPEYVVSDALLCVERQLYDKFYQIDFDSEQEKWQVFLNNCSKIMHDGEKLKMAQEKLDEKVRVGVTYLIQIEEKHPDFRWDGLRNLWILKPGYLCRGNGIVIRRGLFEILEFAKKNTKRTYIVQKYIETPLLIYNTKFDMRLYMLVIVGVNCLTVWLHNDFYLKFSSQQFNMNDLRESIHLTNFTVQKRYKIDPSRDKRLPKCNMWSSMKFKSYLSMKMRTQDLWYTKILPGIKQNLIAVIKASFEQIRCTQNNFELFGCDFMLDDRYNPILIEINATPDLTPSTEITQYLCPKVLRDLIKVVVDLSENKNAPTGQFEMIFKQEFKINKNFNVPYLGLDVKGTAMEVCKTTTNTAHPPILKAQEEIASTSKAASTPDAANSASPTPKKKVVTFDPKQCVEKKKRNFRRKRRVIVKKKQK